MPWVDYQVWSQLVAILQQVDAKLETLLNKEIIMSQAIDNLTAAVAKETTVVSSVVTLISTLAAEIKNLSTEPAVQALADQVTANTTALAKAVTDNTPFTPSGN